MNSRLRFLRISSLIIVATFLFGALSSTASAGAMARTYYCAIAFSPKTGGYGFTYNQPSADAARIVAVRNCGARTGDYRPATYGAHNAWASLAVGPGNCYAWGWGTNKALAELNALKACNRYTPRPRILVSVASFYRK